MGCFVCDLNKEYPELDYYDVVVFSGVLEYIYDVPSLIEYLFNKCVEMIFSYAISDSGPSKAGRRAKGWVNDCKTKTLSIY